MNIVGFHCTTLPGVLGIVQQGYVRKQAHWGFVFVRAIPNPRSLDDIVDLADRIRDSALAAEGVAIELRLQCSYGTLSYGGHEDEGQVCAQEGACYYRSNDTRRRRWTCREEVAEVRACWFFPNARALAEVQHYTPFDL